MDFLIGALISLAVSGVFVLPLAYVGKKLYENRAGYGSADDISGDQNIMAMMFTSEVTPNRAASILGVSKKEIQQMMKTGELRHYVSNGKKFLYAKDLLGFSIRKAAALRSKAAYQEDRYEA